MSQPNVVPRMNRRVLLSDDAGDEETDEASGVTAPGAYLRFASSASGESVSADAAAGSDDEALFAETDPARLASAIAARSKYLTKKGINQSLTHSHRTGVQYSIIVANASRHTSQ